MDNSLRRRLRHLDNASKEQEVELTLNSIQFKLLDIVKPPLFLSTVTPADENNSINKAVSAALKLWTVAFRDISKHRRKNILSRTDPDFVGLLKDPRNFSSRETNKLFGGKFMSEMAKDAAEEKRMEERRRLKTRNSWTRRDKTQQILRKQVRRFKFIK